MEVVVCKCKRCGRKLKNKVSIEKEYGPTCEKKLLQDFYKNNQITIDDILREGEWRIEK